MQILFDFADGNGPVDYSAVLAAPSSGGHSNIQTSVETFAIHRTRGTYARCTGVVNAAAAGLQAPQQGCRVIVRSDAGVGLFSGFVVSTPWHVGAVLNEASPVAFEALEDAAFSNSAIDVSLQPTNAVTHALSQSDNAIVMQQNTADSVADVLVTGAEEPVTYVTELFQGDGTTATFTLTARPFATGGSAALLMDSFTGSQLRANMWSIADPGQHINLGSGGLRITGGNGLDGQTCLSARNPVEMGGTLCAEMRGVLLQPGSAGVLLGFYGNVVSTPTCFAGVQVNAEGGAQSLQALVNGVAVGSAFSWSAGHSYTLRVRLHCAEIQRSFASYQALLNGVVQTWGGGVAAAPMQIVLEVLGEGLASNTPATVLYAGAVSHSLAQAVFAPVNSQSIVASVAGVSLKQQGSAWVTTTQTDGSVQVRRPGAPDTGEDYRVNGIALEFFAGRVPAVGALLTVTYRLAQRSQARMQNSAALTEASHMGVSGLRRSDCRVSDPEPRSAADCAAAAQALLGYYASASYGVRGSCTMPNAMNTADVQPGDSVALPAAATPVLVPITDVTIRSGHSVPEILEYSIAFEQTDRSGLSFRKETGAATDAVQPALLYTVSSTASLPNLTVTMAGSASLQVDAGTDPPVGGGFEVRRHDGGWGPDTAGAAPDSELVLRSPVRSFAAPRAAFAERFYVRMYDGSETPVYSAQSSLLSTHLPVA